MKTKAQIWQQLAALCIEMSLAEGGTMPAGAAPPVNGSTPSRFAVAPGAIADDRELDSAHGDREVRKDPKRWIDGGGASYVGRRFSECPSEYLEALADFKEWSASKPLPGKEQYAENDRKDAARCRGFARRNKGKAMAPVSNGGGSTHGFGGRNGDEVDPPDFGGSDGSGDDSGGAGGADDDIPFTRNRDAEW